MEYVCHSPTLNIPYFLLFFSLVYANLSETNLVLVLNSIYIEPRWSWSVCANEIVKYFCYLSYFLVFLMDLSTLIMLIQTQRYTFQ